MGAVLGIVAAQAVEEGFEFFGMNWWQLSAAVIALVAVISVIAHMMHAASAKSDVTDDVWDFAGRLTAVEESAKAFELSPDRRKVIADIRSIRRSHECRTMSGSDWIRLRDELDELDVRLKDLERELEVRTMMQDIPAKLDGLERKLGDGNLDPAARKRIEQEIVASRGMYADAMTRHDGMDMLDWFILYQLFHMSDRHCDHACGGYEHVQEHGAAGLDNWMDDNAPDDPDGGDWGEDDSGDSGGDGDDSGGDWGGSDGGSDDSGGGD